MTYNYNIRREGRIKLQHIKKLRKFISPSQPLNNKSKLTYMKFIKETLIVFLIVAPIIIYALIQINKYNY